MKRKELESIRKKTIAELRKEVQQLRAEMAKSIVERKVNIPKDTNLLMKKRRQLSVILTVINESELSAQTESR